MSRCSKKKSKTKDTLEPAKTLTLRLRLDMQMLIAPNALLREGVCESSADEILSVHIVGDELVRISGKLPMRKELS